MEIETWVKESEYMRIYLIAYMRLSRRTYFRGVIPVGKLELRLGNDSGDMPSECSARRTTMD